MLRASTILIACFCDVIERDECAADDEDALLKIGVRSVGLR